MNDDKGKCSFHESDFTWNLLFEYWIFFNFPPLSQSFIASQLEDVNCTDLGKTWCRVQLSAHIMSCNQDPRSRGVPEAEYDAGMNWD